jgi:hypothetical protein
MQKSSMDTMDMVSIQLAKSNAHYSSLEMEFQELKDMFEAASFDVDHLAAHMEDLQQKKLKTRRLYKDLTSHN